MNKSKTKEFKITDYHDFVARDTSKEKRAKLYVGNLWINAATCLDCGDYVRSKNKHHSSICKCGNLSVDGGSHYVKRSSITDNYKDHIELFTDLEPEDAE